MKKLIALSLCSVLFLSCATSQINLNSVLNNLNGNGSQNNGSLTNQQMIDGLKEALNVGTNNATVTLNKTDGYFKNLAIKILMPPEAVAVENKLRSIGLGSKVDEAILSMNRAAELAAKDAAPIFLDAIKTMTISDAASIVTGTDHAATDYLKSKTSTQLISKFKPIISKALSTVQATKYWSDVFTTYNKLPFVTKVNPDLTAYVTQKALDGLFYQIGLEEKKIRTDPAAQITTLLQQVFGKH